jgi:hypothetical protein
VTKVTLGSRNAADNKPCKSPGCKYMQRTSRSNRSSTAVRTAAATFRDAGEGDGLVDIAILSLAGLTLSLALIGEVFSSASFELIQQAWLR